MSVAVLTPESDTPAAAPGPQLAAARESRGLTIADIAQQLKLSSSQVEALESGDYSRLPGAVFVRGFIRNYARLVKLDAASLLANAERELPHTGPASPEIAPSANIPFPTARNVAWHKYAIAAVVVLIPLAIFEYYRDDANDAAVKSRQVELPVPQVVGATSPAEKMIAQTIVPAPPAAVETPPADIGAKPASPSPSPSPAIAMKDAPPVRAQEQPDPGRIDAPPAVEVKAARGEQIVRLRFARESWVEIRDRTGRRIFSQLNQPGTEQVVSGLPPLSLVVGNANGVQLIHNEQPVNLGPYIKVDVARLTLE